MGWVVILLGAIAALWSTLRLMANSDFGGLQVTDGYAVPQNVYPAGLIVFDVYVNGAQTAGVARGATIVPYAGTIVDVRGYLDTAPTGSTFICDLMKNAVTMYTTSGNRPTWAISANASSTTLPDILTVAQGDRLRVDNIQIGSTVAGSNLYLTVTMKITGAV